MLSIWAAFGLDLLVGDPYWFPHPVRLMGGYISLVEKNIRRFVSSPFGLKLGGVFLVLTLVLLSYLIPHYLLRLAGRIHPFLFFTVNLLLMWTCLAAKCLAGEGRKIYLALQGKDIVQARQWLSYIVGRDTTRLSEDEIIKATVETVVENTADGVIAPLFFMIVGGAPLAMAYKAVNTMDSMVGYKNERFLHFGWAAARLDDLCNLIPARITGLLLAAAAFFLRLDWRSSLRVMFRDHGKHLSPNCGYPEGAAAGALGIQLGGAHEYFGETVFKPTIGDDHRPVEIEDISRAAKMMYGSSWLGLIIVTVFWSIICTGKGIF